MSTEWRELFGILYGYMWLICQGMMIASPYCLCLHGNAPISVVASLFWSYIGVSRIPVSHRTANRETSYVGEKVPTKGPKWGVVTHFLTKALVMRV